ncbi:MAG TPA: beta-ureidopropionase [candidate division Zixibacteria bacterium]|nr:beta-ureidopropionase [candidate division Zixibacteria bacterium]
MKVGIVQFRPVLGEEWRNFERVRRLIAPVDADLFVLPELFGSGYLFRDRAEMIAHAETFPNGRTLSFMQKLAEEKDCAIVGGFPEVAEDKLYNSAVFIAPEEKPVLYRKIHLFNTEKFIFDAGDMPFPIIEFRGAKIGMMICFDWIFPESYRTLAIRGADIVCHMTNLVLPYCQKASYAHAVSNHIFIMLANRTGADVNAGERIEFTGGSIAYSPDGKVLGKLNETEEAVLTVEFEPEIARNKFVTQHNDVISDRRPEFYDI